MKTQDRSELFFRPKRAIVGARFLLRSALLFLSVLVWAVPSTAAIGPGMESLPLDARYAVSAAIGHDQPDYYARPEGDALQADNAGHGLTARFGASGVELGSGGQRVLLQPVAWGHGEELMFLPEAVPQAIGNFVSVQRGTVAEWYVNGPLGLQQGFTISEASAKAGNGALRVVLFLDGADASSVDADGLGAMLTRADGTALYRYSGLVVRDANGQEAPAWLEARGGMLHICADDTGLNYPVYIDPVIQQAKLTATDGAAGDFFGYSVAMSGDTVVVGAYSANSDLGAAYVFTKPGSGWATTASYAARLTSSEGSANDGFGISVAMSGDTVVVGAPYDDFGAKTEQGSVYVFTKPGSGWATTASYTVKLTAATGAAKDFFGCCVAASGDTIVVGAYGYQSSEGAIYVFEKPAGGWAVPVVGERLLSPYGNAGDRFGAAVAISGDTIVAGASRDTIPTITASGLAYVFEKPLDGWYAATGKQLSSSDRAENDYFGVSVAVGGDIVVVGADQATIGAKARQGSAYVFVRPSTGWNHATENAKLIASDGAANDRLGSSVAVNGDVVVVGAYYAAISGQARGAAYVFMKPAAGWSGNPSQTAKLTAADGAFEDYFGKSVAVSADTVVVGAYKADISAQEDQGAAYVFKINSAPLAFADAYEIRKDKTLTIAAPGVLDNDTDANGDSLTAAVVAQPAHGELALQADGSFTYTPEKGFTGADSFTYKVSDGIEESAPATVLLLVEKKCPLVKMYGQDSAEIDQLYRYRDEVLAKTAPGRLVIRLYYAFTPVIDSLLEDNGGMQRKAKALVDLLLPMIETK